MSQQHDHAWETFQGYIDNARASIQDTFVPVALICMQAEPGEGPTDIRVYPDKDAAIIWPADFPIGDRGLVLMNVAQPYFERTVLRKEQLDS